MKSRKAFIRKYRNDRFFESTCPLSRAGVPEGEPVLTDYPIYPRYLLSVSLICALNDSKKGSPWGELAPEASEGGGMKIKNSNLPYIMTTLR
ncbi:hypothetical protein, partial [Dialister sp.]|uniref:hypothetical protein n=1 Tax=Dialister sp. TaxID=1955814 RepID=UPI002E815DDC